MMQCSIEVIRGCMHSAPLTRHDTMYGTLLVLFLGLGFLHCTPPLEIYSYDALTVHVVVLILHVCCAQLVDVIVLILHTRLLSSCTHVVLFLHVCRMKTTMCFAVLAQDVYRCGLLA